MRREVGVIIAGCGLVLGASSPALAYAPSPSTPAGATGTAPAGTQVCKTADSRLTELSGIVATANGYAVVNDSQPDQSKEKIFFLDGNCKLTSQVSYPRVARDPEDLAIAKDGTIWVADIGDNSQLSGGSGSRRTTIALWKLAPGGKEPVIHRLAYPDGTARDAEALLLSPDGTPVIVTREPIGEVYVPSGPLQPNTTDGVKLKKVGAFTPQKTNTPNPFQSIGNSIISGGAVSPDGTKAVVRTFSDAYEFDVANGDVAKAVTSGKFRITPLPNEPQGEGITYTADGKAFVTCSDQTNASSLLRYTPVTANPAKTGGGAQVPSPAADEKSFLSRLTLQDLTYIVAGVGVFGLLMVLAGIVGIRRSRTRRRIAAAAARATGSRDDDPIISGFPSTPGGSGPGGGGPGPGGTVYGRTAAAEPTGRASVTPSSGRGNEPPGPGGPGAAPAGGGGSRGTVYGGGGAPPPPGVYGSPPLPPPRDTPQTGVYGSTKTYDDDYGRAAGGFDRGARDAGGGYERGGRDAGGPGRGGRDDGYERGGRDAGGPGWGGRDDGFERGGRDAGGPGWGGRDDGFERGGRDAGGYERGGRDIGGYPGGGFDGRGGGPHTYGMAERGGYQPASQQPGDFPQTYGGPGRR
jgi:hypothetical protein